ncbi:MAG TPA: hypothetical protein VIK18_26805 [Pirellulales bacterium]
MRPLFKSSLDATEDLRRFGIFVGLCMLLLISYSIDYDARTGWRFVDYPFSWKISQVTRRQVLSMINERQIKTYGVCRDQILMSSNDGKWLSLIYCDNHDVVRQLGGQGVQYVGYYDYWD